MIRDDESLEKTVDALADLSELLRLSHDAAVRLKQHVPGDYFPTAYKLAKKLKAMEQAVYEMQRHMAPSDTPLPIKKLIHDLISSSDQL
ncbi:MAG: hypothetical protein PVG50_04460 [Thiohalophilus sp.]|jgi:hypothetical protein